MTGWRERLGSLLGRDAGPPAARPVLHELAPGTDPAPTAPAALWAPTRDAAPGAKPAASAIIAVTVLGMAGEALERVLEIAQTQCRAKGARPLFITDGFDLGAFGRQRLLVDQVVDAEARLQAAPELPWHLYRRRQYALLAQRWRPLAVISFGRMPEPDCLEALAPATEPG